MIDPFLMPRKPSRTRVVIDRPYGLSKDIDVTFKECRIFVKAPIKREPGEIEIDPCGCSYLSGKPLKVCDECLQKRLGP